MGAAGLLGILVSSPVHADWADDFDGGFTVPWIFAATDDAGAPPGTGVSTFAVLEGGADDALLIAHSTKALRDGGGGAADGFGYIDEGFTDLAISADVNAVPAQGQQAVLGVLGRGDPDVGSAYLAAVDFSGSRFSIARSDDFIDFQDPLVVDDTVTLDPGRAYHIQFFLIGSTLTARLLDASTRQLLSTISVSDSSYAAGFAGLLVETAYDASLFPVAPIVGSFDNVEAVPEPETAVLWATGVLALAGLAGGSLRRSGGMEGRSLSPSAAKRLDLHVPRHRRAGRAQQHVGA